MITVMNDAAKVGPAQIGRGRARKAPGKLRSEGARLLALGCRFGVR